MAELDIMIETIEKRLKEAKNKRNDHQEALKSIDIKLKRCIGSMGSAPRESIDDLERLIKQTDFEYTSKPHMENKDDKAYVRLRESLHRKKKEMAVYTEKKIEFDDLKSQKSLTFGELNSLDRSIGNFLLIYISYVISMS